MASRMDYFLPLVPSGLIKQTFQFPLVLADLSHSHNHNQKISWVPGQNAPGHVPPGHLPQGHTYTPRTHTPRHIPPGYTPRTYTPWTLTPQTHTPYVPTREGEYGIQDQRNSYQLVNVENKLRNRLG